jgi:outer membrane protein
MALDDYSPKTLMVNLSVPVFTSFQNYTQLKSSYYKYKENQENFFDQLQNTRYVLTETVNKLINLKTQNKLSKINIEFSERNYRIVEQQKEKGLVSNIDFIDAKLNLQNAKLSDISNYYDFITSMVELYYLLGKLEEIIE